MTQSIELSRESLVHNVAVLKATLSDLQCWPCLKANAYGHGVEYVAEILEEVADGFTVVSTAEALRLRRSSRLPIMVLNIVDPQDILECSRRGIVLPLASRQQAQQYRELTEPLSVHLEVDTGMARTGFTWKDPREMLDFVESLPAHIKITGIFSHYAAAGEDHEYTRWQHDRFLPFVEALRALKGTGLMVHIDKSASALIEQYHYKPSLATAFRPGISTYGFDPEWGVVERLRPVLSWKTKIISLRTIARGEKVGYGLTFTARRDTQIATIPVGYADGFDRSLSNRASVLVHGSRCPVRGRVCMNLTMIEVPPNVQVGDEVVLIGSQGEDEYISAVELAGWADTTVYEIVTRLSSEIPRIVV